MRNRGFTFIEVLVAMLIFVFAALAAVDIARGSVRATQEAKTLSKASWLLQSVMTELETKLEQDGIDKACEKKKEGKFEGLYEGFTWITYCTEIDLKLSQTAAQVAKSNDANEPTKEDQMQKMILDVASAYMSKALRELHAEIYWQQGKTKREVSATTHFVRYDLPLQVPGLGLGGAGGGTPGTSPTPAPGSGH